MEMSEALQSNPARRGLPLTWIAAGVIALIVLSLLVYSLLGNPTDPPQVGSPVPDFQLTAFDGSPMNPGDHLGQVVVVNFFASWCAPCRQEAADLEQAWRAYQDRGVQFFGIAYKDAGSRAQTFVDQYDVTYPSTADTNNRTARTYGLTGVPETFIVDQQGLLTRHFLGPVTQEQVSQELDSLLLH